MFALHPAVWDALRWLLILLGSIAALVGVVYFVRRLRDRSAASDDEEAMLVQFHEMYRDGKLSSREYQEIRLSLAEQKKSARPPDRPE